MSIDQEHERSGRRTASGWRGEATAVVLGALVLFAASTLGPWTASPIRVSTADAAPSVLATGFNDALRRDRADRDAWLTRMRSDGAGNLRILAVWALIAPAKPPTGSAARDPEWTGYRFAFVDDAVRHAVAAGLEPMIMTFHAPRWAERAGRPDAAPAGTWKPSSLAYGRFMRAVAARYSGRTPDPLTPGAVLPRVRSFQVWNEPNLSIYLTPQWDGEESASPGIYRALQNAAYRSIKAVRPDALVVTSGASPFGETPAGSSRMRPVRFWRDLLCMDRELRRTCGFRTKTDVIAHHPYPTGGPPARPAYNKDDMSVADVKKLVRIAGVAVRRRILGPRRPALWITEFAVRSNPPERNGYGVYSLAEQARFMAEATWRLWRQGASRIFYFNNVDERDLSGHGTYLADGRPKPAARAARFPAYAYADAGRLAVWVRPPVDGRMAVQVRRGGRWRTVRTVTAQADRPRTVRVPRGGVTSVRARIGDTTSYAWTVR